MKRPSSRRKKDLYKGVFNYHGEVYVIYRKATTEFHAFSLFVRAIARSLHLASSYTIRNYFTNGGGLWEIQRSSGSMQSKEGRSC
jgi:hypothetical protein